MLLLRHTAAESWLLNQLDGKLKQTLKRLLRIIDLHNVTENILKQTINVCSRV